MQICSVPVLLLDSHANVGNHLSLRGIQTEERSGGTLTSTWDKRAEEDVTQISGTGAVAAEGKMVDLRPLWHSRPLRLFVCLLLVLASRSGSPLTTWAEVPGDVRPPEATLLNFLFGDQWSLEGDKR